MGPKLTSQAGEARRQELLLLLSTPLQADQASPQGWEKLPEWLGWTNDSRGQPSPSGRAVLPGLWSRLPGHCGGTRGEGGGARTELRGSQWLKSAQRQAAAEGLRARGSAAGLSVQARAEAGSLGHTRSQRGRGFRGGHQPLLGLGAQGRASPFAPGHPVPSHIPWIRPLASPHPKLRDAPGIWGAKKKTTEPREQ